MGFLENVFVKRDPSSHKGNFGMATIIGGSKCYVGAPKFAAESSSKILTYLGESAMRVGAGLSCLAVPDFLCSALYENVNFSSIYSLESEFGYIKFSKENIDELLKKSTSFAIGMGMGKGEADKIVKYILSSSNAKIVIDADALDICKDLDFDNRCVLTPHIGEFARMLKIYPEEVIANAESLAKNYAKSHNCVLVLKSDRSIITDGKDLYINKTGNERLAKGGSGDVLSGIIAGILAYSDDLFSASCSASFILGKCADIAHINPYSCLPSDIISQIPQVLDEIVPHI